MLTDADEIYLLSNVRRLTWNTANFNVPGIRLLSQLPLDAMKAVGTHNHYNAAVAALSVIGLDVGIDIAAISSTIDKLKAPPHGMQIGKTPSSLSI